MQFELQFKASFLPVDFGEATLIVVIVYLLHVQMVCQRREMPSWIATATVELCHCLWILTIGFVRWDCWLVTVRAVCRWCRRSIKMCLLWHQPWTCGHWTASHRDFSYRSICCNCLSLPIAIGMWAHLECEQDDENDGKKIKREKWQRRKTIRKNKFNFIFSFKKFCLPKSVVSIFVFCSMTLTGFDDDDDDIVDCNECKVVLS